MARFTSLLSRVFFAVAFVLLGFAVWEKLANLMGLTLLRVYSPFRLLEFAALVLLFVIALQLREIKTALSDKS
jgi:hypothetical protein